MLNSHYREMLQNLSDENVEFLIVGAFALAAHGIPRSTGDIDIWVRPSFQNAAKLFKALADYGAPLGDTRPNDFTQTDIVFQIGVIPLRIDILTSIDGVSFEQAYAERKVVDMDGLSVPVLSRKCLIQNKKSVGRDKDLLDIKLLEEG